jgi:hypothetical protein
MSGPNLMSGLAAVGGTVVGGIVVLGAGAGLLAGGAMCVALRDKPMLPDEERQTRRAGRYGAIGGAAVGVGVAVHTVGAMGIAGYSAAGLTSGLAALGGVVGGGMTQGVLAALFIPAFFAAGIGYLLYRLVRWVSAPSQNALPTGELSPDQTRPSGLSDGEEGEVVESTSTEPEVLLGGFDILKCGQTRQFDGGLEAQPTAYRADRGVEPIHDRVTEANLELKESELTPHVVWFELTVLEQTSHVPSDRLGDPGEQLAALALMLGKVVGRRAGH